MKRDATISADGLYRYDLTRTVQAGCSCVRCIEYRARAVATLRAGYVLWVLCNPSTADAETDDPTERRGWGYALRWGFGKFVFVNTNPFRSTDPKKARLPNSEATYTNYETLMNHAAKAELVVCAWGANANPFYAQRTLECLRLTVPNRIHCLALTSKGVPKHPLYLPGDLSPQRWNP